jgi:uncharacterized cupin superfamily protein
MPIRNFLERPYVEDRCHDGEGKIKMTNVFGEGFQTPLQFLHYTVLPPGTSIGAHTHANDEELYIILSGHGMMEIDGETSPVKKGDVILNRPFGTHSLTNTSDTEEIQVLVMEVAGTAQMANLSES